MHLAVYYVIHTTYVYTYIYIYTNHIYIHILHMYAYAPVFTPHYVKRWSLVVSQMLVFV